MHYLLMIRRILKMSKENSSVPFQVQSVIDQMLNPKDNVHLRGNFRLRLAQIQTEIDKAIAKYDQELFTKQYKKGK